MHLNRRQSWMWAEACALLDQAERKHRHFFELLSARSAQPPAWEPPADIFSDGTELEIVVALPGALPEDVQIEFTTSGIEIGTTVAPPARPNMRVVRLEVPYGRMRRRIDLPPGHYALVDRRLERGRLHLRLRRDSV